MFGVGAQESVIIGLLALLVFGPGRFPEMAREFGRVARWARDWWDDSRSDLGSLEGHHDPGPRERDRGGGLVDEEPSEFEDDLRSTPDEGFAKTDDAERGLR